MAELSRKHHYILKFYLKGFLSDDCQDIWVLDKILKKQWNKKRLEDVASERDFYRIELPDLKIDEVENKCFDGSADSSPKEIV